MSNNGNIAPIYNGVKIGALANSANLPIITSVLDKIGKSVDSLFDSTNLSEMLENRKIIELSINSFVNAVNIIDNASDRVKLINLFRKETIRIADDENLDHIMFFVYAYLDKLDKEGDFSNIPQIEDVLDLSHTYVFLALIYIQSQNTPKSSYINNIVKKAINSVSVKELLSTAKGYKGKDFEYFLAFEIFRSVVRDGEFKGYETNMDIIGKTIDIEMNESSLDLYDLFIVSSTRDFLSAEDPLIMVLSEILDYDEDIYKEILSRIKINEYGLHFSSYYGFKDVVNNTIGTYLAPKKIKNAYHKEDSKVVGLEGGLFLDYDDDSTKDTWIEISGDIGEEGFLLSLEELIESEEKEQNIDFGSDDDGNNYDF